MEPLGKRLCRRIGLKQTETRCWAASYVCEQCRSAEVSRSTSSTDSENRCLPDSRRRKRCHSFLTDFLSVAFLIVLIDFALFFVPGFFMRNRRRTAGSLKGRACRSRTIFLAV